MSELQYPFDTLPASGTTMEVAPGVYWLRMPLPMSLDHINLYLIEDDDGWWIIDTGLKGENTQKYWQQIFDNELKDKPIKAVIVTHMHPDHVGQAGWICEKFRVPLYMTFGEYYAARCFSHVAPTQVAWTTERYCTAVGFTGEKLERVKRGFGGFGSIVEPLPMAFIRIDENSVFTIAGRKWTVGIGSGHSPEHACLYCEELGVLLSGDQVIPKITSNVMVMPGEPEANPLLKWMQSLNTFFKYPSDTLVLPAHNTPFTGLHIRLAYLIAHHEDHLLAIEEACVEEKNAVELLPVLFKRELGFGHLIMAVGECVAHLNYLMVENKLQRTMDANGVYQYLSIDPTLKQRAKPGAHHQSDAPMEV